MHTSIPPAIALASALALLSPADALASACCGTGHGIGQRLADTEDAALVASFRGASRIGAWTSSRDFDVPGEGDFDRELRGEIGWLVRVKRRFELGVTVPFLSTWKQAGELAAWGGGV